MPTGTATKGKLLFQLSHFQLRLLDTNRSTNVETRPVARHHQTKRSDNPGKSAPRKRVETALLSRIILLKLELSKKLLKMNVSY